MNAPEIRQLAEDYLALPPGEYVVVTLDPVTHYVVGANTVPVATRHETLEAAEAEARRLNAMPALLKGMAEIMVVTVAGPAMAGLATDLSALQEVEALLDLAERCEAHQRGESHE